MITMARRRNNESFMDLLVLLPWWLTLIAGAGIWLYLRWHPAQGGGLYMQASIIRFALTDGASCLWSYPACKGRRVTFIRRETTM